ncbi:MAG: PA0069 family radical SAM protein [Phycisphaerales bacterium]
MNPRPAQPACDQPGDEAEFAHRTTHGFVRGRGAQLNPPNRFEPISLHVLGEHLDEIAVEHPGSAEGGVSVRTRVFRDHAKTVINPVDSPDLHMKWTLNPYRGCEHGCVYCYARPTHETFGLSCGLDFETQIFAKEDAPALLLKELAHPKWTGEPIMLSGITDPYQPVERALRITRRCLEVMAACGQPVTIVTKNAMVTRDIDVIAALAKVGAANVALSITTLDNRLASTMEPRASAPGERLRAIRTLADAGIPVTVMVAPVIPALNDHEILTILKAAQEHGATGAGYVLLRLPYQIKELYLDWLAREFPDRAAKAESQLREARRGELYQSGWKERQRGVGARAEQIKTMFEMFKRSLGMNERGIGASSGAFRRPFLPDPSGQMGLFG